MTLIQNIYICDATGEVLYNDYMRNQYSRKTGHMSFTKQDPQGIGRKMMEVKRQALKEKAHRKVTIWTCPRTGGNFTTERALEAYLERSKISRKDMRQKTYWFNPRDEEEDRKAREEHKSVRIQSAE